MQIIVGAKMLAGQGADMPLAHSCYQFTRNKTNISRATLG